jgi:hypothetical protein
VHGVKAPGVAGGPSLAAATLGAAEDLAASVHKMVVDGAVPVSNPSLWGVGGNSPNAKSRRERVSGMDSYFGTSEGTLQEDLTSGTAGLASSLHERLQRAKPKVGGAW